MTSPSSTGISHDAFFMAAVKKLPEELQGALTSAGLDDPGLLAVYPRTHWRTLGLKPIGTRDPCRARSNSPYFAAIDDFSDGFFGYSTDFALSYLLSSLFFPFFVC